RFINDGGAPDTCAVTAPVNGVDQLEARNLELAPQDGTCVLRAINSGGPLRVFPATSFTVTATNIIGTDTTPATISIQVEPPLKQSTASTPQALFGSHNCVINRFRQLFCWGDDSNGQLGNGLPLANSGVPVRVGTASNWLDLDTGINHTCAINLDNELYCWGSDAFGQLGNGDDTDGLVNGIAATPVRIGTESNWASLSLGARTSCAIKGDKEGDTVDGQLWCWGDNQHRQVIPVDAATSMSDVPVRINIPFRNDSLWQEIAQGDRHACAILKPNGELFCWGLPGLGGTGNDIEGDNPEQRQGVVAIDLTNVMDAEDTNTWSTVSTGFDRTCALNTSGAIYCWGAFLAKIPTLAPGDATNWSSISVGAEHYCAIKLTGEETKNELWCSGLQLNG
ncbi:MAG: hypothetical protein K8963_06780, partial [Proteobacteria bacterium]|nr:hypothetical protein [Pseudomonadota bacterium]